MKFVILMQQKHQLSDNRMEHPAIRKGLDRITTSLNNLGDTFEKAFEVMLMLKKECLPSLVFLGDS